MCGIAVVAFLTAAGAANMLGQLTAFDVWHNTACQAVFASYVSGYIQ
jgi:hypothetical protein